jgi:DNA-binding LytR/AlgR family response regulator
MEPSYTLRIAVCEDLPTDMEIIKNHIVSSGFPLELSCFVSGEEFLRSFSAGRYDVIFMDIFLGGESGVKIAENIRRKDRHATLAFTTISTEHYSDGYNLKAYRYIKKPAEASHVEETLNYALMKKNNRAAIPVIMEGGKARAIPLDAIMFFEQKDKVITVVTTESGTLRTSQSVRLDDLENALPKPRFLRCHRSMIVNLSHVGGVDKDTHSFILHDGRRVGIYQRYGLRKYIETFQNWLDEETRRM